MIFTEKTSVALTQVRPGNIVRTCLGARCPLVNRCTD